MSITKKWLIAACILFVIGLILCFVSFIIPGNDFNRITVRKYETNTYDVDEAFDNIKIVADKAEITVVPSDDDPAEFGMTFKIPLEGRFIDPKRKRIRFGTPSASSSAYRFGDG